MALSKNNRLHEVAMQKLNSMDTPVLLKVSFPQGLRTLSENDPAMLRLLGTDVQAFWDRIAQDPHRKDLYRLWLSRNCAYLNNMIPILLLALLSNVDCQAVLHKKAVI